MTIAERTAETASEGPLASGSGTIRPASGALGELPEAWVSRTGQPGGKTSPEELAAAAHSSCFAMALALRLAERKAAAQRLTVAATVTLDEGDGTPTIISSRLRARGRVPGLDVSGFQEAVSEAAPPPGVPAVRRRQDQRDRHPGSGPVTADGTVALGQLASGALEGLLILATAVWTGGLVAIFVVARVARHTLMPRDRVAFFRGLGRRTAQSAGSRWPWPSAAARPCSMAEPGTACSSRPRSSRPAWYSSQRPEWAGPADDPPPARGADTAGQLGACGSRAPGRRSAAVLRAAIAALSLALYRPRRAARTVNSRCPGTTSGAWRSTHRVGGANGSGVMSSAVIVGASQSAPPGGQPGPRVPRCRALSLRLTGTDVIVRLGGIPERPRHLAKPHESRGFQCHCAPGDLIATTCRPPRTTETPRSGIPAVPPQRWPGRAGNSAGAWRPSAA